MNLHQVRQVRAGYRADGVPRTRSETTVCRGVVRHTSIPA